MAYGLWLMAHGSWLMAHGSWLMAHGSWLMAYGLWLILTWSECYSTYYIVLYTPKRSYSKVLFTDSLPIWLGYPAQCTVRTVHLTDVPTRSINQGFVKGGMSQVGSATENPPACSPRLHLQSWLASLQQGASIAAKPF